MKRSALKSILFVLAVNAVLTVSGPVLCQTRSGGQTIARRQDGAPQAGERITLEGLLAQTRRHKAPFFARTDKASASVAGATGPLPVIGSGAVGFLTVFSGQNSDFLIGNSSIFQNKAGDIGVGTTSPTSLLTVGGVIQSTSGGYMFPDGTVQTTAGIASGLALTGVAHDATLGGAGTAASPLRFVLPASLTASAPDQVGAVIQVQNTALGGTGLAGIGGPTDAFPGIPGNGVVGLGGPGEHFSGAGVLGVGGNTTGTSATLDAGGSGIAGIGGNGLQEANGGDGGTFFGGEGGLVSGDGGHGISATGGFVNAAGGAGGAGILATGGQNGDKTFAKAGIFVGDVEVTGNISKAGGSFKIDHPLDPENKYLYHSFVESPDMMNIYNGAIVTDSTGQAVVSLPDWFQAVNRDFRYQLTVIGQFAQAMIESELKDNHFTIRTSAPGVKVSWQVTGIRQDAWANAHRIPVEEEKTGVERGHYLHPELYGQPDDMSVFSARNPELAKKIKAKRERSSKTDSLTSSN